MEQIILSGPTATGVISAVKGLGVDIRSVEIDVPLDEVGTTDPAVTISGNVGAYTFHSDTTLNLRYGNTEDVVVTTNGAFTAEYSAIIRYVRTGDMTAYMYADDRGSDAGRGLIPSWTRRTPRSS